MRERTLGSTGIRVSEIGFGAWGLGSTMWLGVPEEEGNAALRAALDAGVNFIDTALAYGDGHSERRIGAILRERPDLAGVTVATKIPPKDSRWPGRADAKLEDVFPASWIVSCCETSLRNLGVGSLDLQQLHVWHDAWLSDPAWDETYIAMGRLKAAGRVRHWGISVNAHDPDSAIRALSDPIFESVQLIYNIYDRAPEGGTFDLAREKNLGVIVRVPFDEGALTGAIRPDTTFPDGDWRNRYFRGDRKGEAARRADALAELLGDEAATLPELALRFVLSRPEVSTVIPGMRRPEHARTNAAVSDGRPLSPGLLRRLRAHAWTKNWHLD